MDLYRYPISEDNISMPELSLPVSEVETVVSKDEAATGKQGIVHKSNSERIKTCKVCF